MQPLLNDIYKTSGWNKGFRMSICSKYPLETQTLLFSFSAVFFMQKVVTVSSNWVLFWSVHHHFLWGVCRKSVIGGQKWGRTDRSRTPLAWCSVLFTLNNRMPWKSKEKQKIKGKKKGSKEGKAEWRQREKHTERERGKEKKEKRRNKRGKGCF